MQKCSTTTIHMQYDSKKHLENIKNYVFEDFANVKYSYLVSKAKYNCYFASYNILDLDVKTNHSFSNFTVALPATVHYWKKGKNQIGLASHYQFFQ